MALEGTTQNGITVACRIRYKADWAEYEVHLYVGGKHMVDATYFTDDLTDAKGTAKLMFDLELCCAKCSALKDPDEVLGLA